MATKAEIRKYLLPKQISKLQNAIMWDDIRLALDPSLGAVTEEQLDRLVVSFKKKDYNTVGKIIAKAVNKKVEDDAKLRINEYLSNNTLGLDELGEVLL